MVKPWGYPACASSDLAMSGSYSSWLRPELAKPGSEGSNPALNRPRLSATLFRIVLLSMAWAIACRTRASSQGEPFALRALTPIQMPSPSTVVTTVVPEAALRVATFCGGTWAMNSTWPPWSCETRVLSCGTMLTVTAPKPGFVPQYLLNRFNLKYELT